MGRTLTIGSVSLMLLALIVVPAASTGTSGAAPAAAKAKKKFNPSKYAGEWRGTWKNETFDTEGPATMDLEVKGKRKTMVGTFDLGGNAFGCPDPEPRTVTIKKGKGDNRWSKKGFKASWENDSGTQHLKYKHAKKRLTGDGFSPCNEQIQYSYVGKMTKKKITAETEITMSGDPFATSKLKMTKR